MTAVSSRRWWPSGLGRLRPWPLATQAIALQILVIAVVVLAGSALALFDARNDGDNAARQQVLGIATALADSPSTATAIESGRATETLQPVTEAVRKNTDIAFITIMAPDRTRFTHTDPNQIGGKYIGTIEPALRGEPFTEVYTGTLGPSIRAVAPVRDGTGRIVGLVSAGILQQSLADRWRSQVPTIAAVSLAALAIALVGVWAIRRRLLRQTHGLRPDELRVMYEHHDAILHSVSEGLIVLDRNGVALANDEAPQAARAAARARGPVGSAGIPAHLQPGSARRGARHRGPGARRQPLPRRRWAARLRGRDHPRPYRIARRAGRTQLAEGPDRQLAVAGPRGGQQAAHHRHDGRDGPRRRSRQVRDQRARAVTTTGRPALQRRR